MDLALKDPQEFLKFLFKLPSKAERIAILADLEFDFGKQRNLGSGAPRFGHGPTIAELFYMVNPSFIPPWLLPRLKDPDYSFCGLNQTLFHLDPAYSFGCGEDRVNELGSFGEFIDIEKIKRGDCGLKCMAKDNNLCEGYSWN